jgi:hypothetical protein
VSKVNQLFWRVVGEVLLGLKRKLDFQTHALAHGGVELGESGAIDLS